MNSWNPFEFNFEHIHLEISSKCVLKCPRCPRTEHPETPWLGKQLSLVEIKQILPEDIIKNEVKRITICGDVGDPIYNTDFHQILSFFKSINPKVHLYIITNGSYRAKNWWEKTASILNENDTVAFSVDGYDDRSNQLYRVGSDWASIETAMQEIKYSKAFMVWAVIVFNFNENFLDDIEHLARIRGCDYLQITKSTKFGKNYKRFNADDSTDPLQPSAQWISGSLRFERTQKKLGFREIDNLNFMKSMTEKTILLEKKYKDSTVFPLCKNSNRGLFINVKAQIYPCSWVSFPYDKTVSLKTGRTLYYKDSFFIKNSEKFCLLKRNFYDVIADPAWSTLFSSFNDIEKCFIECEHKCRKEVMTPDYQVGWFLN